MRPIPLLLLVLLVASCATRASGPRLVATQVQPDSTCERYGLTTDKNGATVPLWYCPTR